MGKKNTGSNGRSKKRNGNKGMIHPGKQGDNTQLFHAGQHHGVTSFKIHWAYRSGTGIASLDFHDRRKIFSPKFDENYKEKIDHY